ncbi:unnamed protein product [Ostreobium quekettii]|uniref:Spatacsin C-terminal domain-containing protein n=1 Tax=Ostreobium quekettii TaxID=121088 RepID=A0A8S1J5K1_9CHLO|nr:unnamed protein product [Ostreobium quekettii]
MSNAIICGDWPEVGNALLQLLLERHAALPSQVEADILVLSHNFYRRCQYVEGIDVLLELAGSRIEVYASEKNYSALVKIILGLGLYEGFRKPLDLLVQHNQLELLLKECQLTGDDARALRAAVLRSIDLHRPNDVLALDLVHKHFDVHVDIAHGLKKQALAKLEGYVKQRSNTRLLLGAMELLLMAAMEYSAADCCVAAARCSAMVALVAQQICLPERQWVLLSDSQCRKVLPKLPNIGEALVVARGYKFSSPQDWVLTLWEHMLEVASQFRVPLGVLSGRMDAMQSFAQGVQREAVFSEDQLEQIAQMYVDQRGQRSGYVLGRVNKAVLASCMLEFLRSIPDCQQRLALSQRIGGDEMAALVKECLTILDAELPSLPQADGNGVL